MQSACHGYVLHVRPHCCRHHTFVRLANNLLVASKLAPTRAAAARSCPRLHRMTQNAQNTDSQIATDKGDDSDVPFEKQLKGRARTKSKKSQTQTANKTPQPAVQQATSMPAADQFEGSAVLVLVALFAAIIGQGLFLALSGFLSEGLDQFAQDVVYKTFSPTVGLFLACSAGYGLWKTKQDKK